jgi:transposase
VLIERLKSSGLEPLFEKLNTSLRLSQERSARLERENQLLRQLRRLDLLEKYGPAGEQLSDEQLELLELEPGVSSAEVKAESEREQLKLPLKEFRKHPGRQELPAHLPRVEKIIACSPEQCICGHCGKETGVIGYEQSEQLDVEPAKYFVVVTKREKRACKDCEEQGVARAPVPVRIIEKGLASDRVIIDTVVSKYADYVPIYRQSAILKRETGIDLSRATLDSWVMRVGELLRPITAAMGQELLNGTYLQADETTVGVQMHDGREKIIRLISGNTAGRAARRCLTSEWVGSEKGPSGSWATLQASSKATGTALTIRWVENRSFMPRAGRMPGESSLMQSNSIPEIRPRFGSWRRWMSFLPSTPKPAKKA